MQIGWIHIWVTDLMGKQDVSCWSCCRHKKCSLIFIWSCLVKDCHFFSLSPRSIRCWTWSVCLQVSTLRVNLHKHKKLILDFVDTPYLSEYVAISTFFSLYLIAYVDIVWSLLENKSSLRRWHQTFGAEMSIYKIINHAI